MRSILYLTAFLFAVSPAFADNTCGENCTWEITNGELKIHGTGNMDNYGYGTAPWYGQKNSINKISVDEGISSIGNVAFYQIPATSISLPTTLKSIGSFAFRESNLTSINLPDGLENIGTGAFTCPVSTIEFPASVKSIGGLYTSGKELIFNANNNVPFSAGYASDITAFSGDMWNSVNVKCKGEKAKCEQMLANVAARYANAGKDFSVSYYSGLNKDGNWEVWSENGKAVYEDSGMQKLLSKYDFDGNQTGLYQYDSGGNLVKAVENGNVIYRRRIYTISEATAAVQNNKNKFSIIYR